eukprot:14006467-Ditylum_brightwellii.AAC.1
MPSENKTRKKGKMKLYHQQMVQRKDQMLSVLDVERRGTSPINALMHKNWPLQCYHWKQRKYFSL